MVGVHVNALRHPRSTTTKSMIKATDCDAASKQWYTLVKLDEYGAIGHVASDEELLQLEEELLQVEEAAETGCEFGSLSGEEQEEEVSVSEDVQSLDDESEEDTPAASEDTSVQPLQPLQMPAYQKPGGPCDHCGAVGTSPIFHLLPGRKSHNKSIAKPKNISRNLSTKAAVLAYEGRRASRLSKAPDRIPA
jgi:hypothetical protein